jgi:hypothetical protein
MCVVSLAPARCHGSASWSRKACGCEGPGRDWIAICCTVITKQRDGYSAPFRAEYRRDNGDLLRAFMARKSSGTGASISWLKNF